MPWLAATALLHSSIVAEKRDTLKAWTILLAIVAFSFSLLGTFIVRSGVLVSVHAFASDPSRGIYILLLLCFFTGGALFLFAKKSPYLRSGSLFQPISREGALIINNIIFSSAAATVLIGTLYPLFVDAISNTKVSVGPPYFEAVFIPLMIPALLICAFSPMISWKRSVLSNLYERIIAIFIISILITSFIIFIYGGSYSAFLGIFLGFWVICGTLYELIIKIGVGKKLDIMYSRILTLPRSSYGMSLAHIGVAIFVIGVTVSSAWKVEIERSISIGEDLFIKDYKISFDSYSEVKGPNWIAERGSFTVSKNEKIITMLLPERRFYPASEVTTTEPAIMTNIFADLYIVLGENIDGGNSYGLRAYYSPLLNWIWIGIGFMVFLSLIHI